MLLQLEHRAIFYRYIEPIVVGRYLNNYVFKTLTPLGVTQRFLTKLEAFYLERLDNGFKTEFIFKGRF